MTKQERRDMDAERREVIRNLLATWFCLASLLAYCNEEHPCGSIPDPFPVSQPTRSARVSLRTLSGGANIPTRWDARDYGWVTPVKNQGSYGTCWSFAACSVLETALLKSGYGEFDLSEKNMVLYTGWNATANTGGNITMSGNYFTSWQGPALEDEDPYPTSGSSVASFGHGRMVLPKFKVLGAVRIPARVLSSLENWSTMLENTMTMKEAIMKYGSLVVPYNSCTRAGCYDRSSGATFCNEYTNTTSHLVAVVGWNDDYSKSNFKRTPPGDGAWIVKNSWGTNRDDNGYLHISYYDTTFGFAAEMEAFILANANQDYDAVYNYARAGFCRARGWHNTTDTLARLSSQPHQTKDYRLLVSMQCRTIQNTPFRFISVVESIQIPVRACMTVLKGRQHIRDMLPFRFLMKLSYNEDRVFR